MTARLWIDPAEWPLDWSGVDATMGLIDLARPLPSSTRRDMDSRPPFPLIGIGDGPCDLADAIVGEDMLPQIERNIAAVPHAAAIAVQLLRIIEQSGDEAALIAESLAFATLQGSEEFRRWLASGERPAPTHTASPPLNVDIIGSTLRIGLSSPVTRNAIDRVMRDALSDAFLIAASDPAIARVTIDAQGKCFSIGGALHEFGTARDPATAHLIRSRTLPARMMLRRASIYEVHVRGACIGAGIELAAFAGRLTASRDAWFQLPELSMGLIPGAGGCVSITRRIGRQRTALMILSGRRINAATALDWGLIDAIEEQPPFD